MGKGVSSAASFGAGFLDSFMRTRRYKKDEAREDRAEERDEKTTNAYLTTQDLVQEQQRLRNEIAKREELVDRLFNEKYPPEMQAEWIGRAKEAGLSEAEANASVAKFKDSKKEELHNLDTEQIRAQINASRASAGASASQTAYYNQQRDQSRQTFPFELRQAETKANESEFDFGLKKQYGEDPFKAGRLELENAERKSAAEVKAGTAGDDAQSQLFQNMSNSDVTFRSLLNDITSAMDTPSRDAAVLRAKAYADSLGKINPVISEIYNNTLSGMAGGNPAPVAGASPSAATKPPVAPRLRPEKVTTPVKSLIEEDTFGGLAKNLGTRVSNALPPEVPQAFKDIVDVMRQGPAISPGPYPSAMTPSIAPYTPSLMTPQQPMPFTQIDPLTGKPKTPFGW